MPQDAKAKELIFEYETLKSERSVWDSMWQNIADYVLPLREFQTTHSPGDFRYRKNFDASAANALDEFAAYMHGTLVNPALKWFRLRFQDTKLNQSKTYREWLESAEEILYSIINSTQLNFNSQIHEVFLDEGAFGMSGLFLADRIDEIRMSYVPLNELYIDEDDMGTVNRLYRPVCLSGYRALKKFGERLPKKIYEAAEKDKTKKFDFLHAVRERVGRSSYSPFAEGMKFESCWISMDEQQSFIESGFREFPYLVPRFSKAQGEVNGRGPAHKVFSSILVANRMKQTQLRGIQKAVDPPLKVLHDDVLSAVRTAPNATIKVRRMDAVGVLEQGARPDVGQDFLTAEREEIRRGFFLHLFTIPQADRMTAAEFNGRVRQQLQQLSPQVSRLQTELLAKFVTRIFNIAMRSRVIPMPPREIQGAQFDIDFVSPLSLAQSASDVDNIMQFINVVTPFVNFNPQILQNMDLDKATRFIALRLNVPQSLMNETSIVERVRQQQQDAAQKQEVLDQLMKGAKASKDAAAGLAPGQGALPGGGPVP